MLAVIFQVRWRLLPLLAVLIGVIWAFSIVAIVGIDLSLVTISGLPILIGLGIDFAIHYIARYREELDRRGDRMDAGKIKAAVLIVAGVARTRL